MKPLGATFTVMFKRWCVSGWVFGRGPLDGAGTGMVAVNTVAMLARMNIRTFMMMSRNGMMLSSPPPSSGPWCLGLDRRLMIARCAAVNFPLIPGYGRS